MTNEPEQPDRESSPPGILEIAFSVMAAALGVQNRQNRERDFSQGNPLAYIVAGLIFTLLFVTSLVLIVSLVVS